MVGGGQRNSVMAGRIERTPVRYPFRFVVAGDSGAWPDPTADGIFSGLAARSAARVLRPARRLRGPGDAGPPRALPRAPGGLSLPDVCVVGNHDLDDASGSESLARVHGPMNFSFAYGHTRFVVLHSQPGVTGEVEVRGADTAEGLEGPREADLAFLDSTLAAAGEPHRVVLMHMPPNLDGRFAPHEDWGFRRREAEFLALLAAHGVRLVCCAHGLAFDQCVRDGTRFVMSGGGGSGLCSHYAGICTEGTGRPEDRGSLYHAVEITMSEAGAISGRVLQAFDRAGGGRIRFGDETAP